MPPVIYKITSPSNKVYIGQTIDIIRRHDEYQRLSCKNQVKLYNSFIKYGFDSHIIEILCECTENDLNRLERYYQEINKAVGKNGLNLKLTQTNTRSGVLSSETRRKISKSNKGKPKSIEAVAKSRLSRLGGKRSLETRKKMSNSKIGKARSKQLKDKMKLCCWRNKIVLDIVTGVFFNTIGEASKTYNINHNTLREMLIGTFKNKTTLILV